MKAKFLFSVLAVAGFVMANANSAEAGFFRHGGCCEPTCCAAEPTCCAPEPACCAPEPTCCEAAPCCDSGCNSCCKRHPIRDFFKKLCSRKKCCASSCCEPTCCAPEPTCGCGH